MDIKNRVMGDMPHDFLHKIAGIVPGYHGYVDRERRRDADKLLRTTLAHHYSAQKDRLTRIQQGLLRGHHLEEIAEVDRLAGLLQRFIDRLSVATYGYAGLFDPIKVEAADLDQLYAFDMTLAGGVDQVSGAVDAVEASAGAQADLAELPAAISRLSGIVDELNRRLNERADLLTSGIHLPDTDYHSMLDSLSQPSQAGSTSGDMARYTPDTGAASPGAASTPAQPSSAGTPTTNLNSGAAGSIPGGIETASSPVNQPGAPGGDIVEGLEMAPDHKTR